MNVAAVISLAYGFLVFAGGWFGFKKAGSRPSLVAGAVSGALLILAAALSFAGLPAGRILAMAVAGVLLVFFGIRLARSGKFMPAGIMVLASLAALAVLAWGTAAH